MITKADIMSYRGRRFPKYWLTVRGSAFALLNGVNPEKIRLNALESCEKDEDRKAIEAYFQLREINPKIANILDRFILLVSKLEPTELIKQLLPELDTMNENDIKEVFGVAKKTGFWGHTEKTMKKLMNGLRKALNYEGRDES